MIALAFWAMCHAGTASAEAVPNCRFDDSYAATVRQVLQGAIDTYTAIGKPLRIKAVTVNAKTASKDPPTLPVYIVKDAGQVTVSKEGCPKLEPRRDDPLDTLSVRSGCLATVVEPVEIRCSAQAVRIFAGKLGLGDRLPPPLLYVLAHELGHVYQKREGQYGGRLERVNLGDTQQAKLSQLRTACEPGETDVEAQADALALEILKKLLPTEPYRERALSMQGSAYWAIDQIYAAANQWQQSASEREFMSQGKPHAAFIPIELPSSPGTIERNAKSFVCEALTKRSGFLQYPLRAISHPPLNQRMRQVAEALKPVASALPKSNGKEYFPMVAQLQENLGPIFTHIYRETGVYMEHMKRAVCTRVNAEQPLSGC